MLESRDLNVAKLSITTDQDSSGHEALASGVSSGAVKGPLSRLAAYQLPNLIVRDYLRKKEPVFRELDDLREKVKYTPDFAFPVLLSDRSTGLEQYRRRQTLQEASRKGRQFE